MARATITLDCQWSPLAAALTRLGTVAEAELRELLRLADLVGADGGVEPAAVALDQPVYVAGVPLYRPSLGLLAWLEDRFEVQHWCASNPRERELLTAYGLHLARQPQRLRELYEQTEALGAMRNWLADFGGTEEELLAAAQAAFAGFPASAVITRTDPASTLQAAHQHLQRGGSLDAWLWDHSAQQCAWLSRYALAAQHGPVYGRGQAMRAFQAYVNQRAAAREVARA